jgi:hypothetical protein
MKTATERCRDRPAPHADDRMKYAGSVAVEVSLVVPVRRQQPDGSNSAPILEKVTTSPSWILAEMRLAWRRCVPVGLG